MYFQSKGLQFFWKVGRCQQQTIQDIRFFETSSIGFTCTHVIERVCIYTNMNACTRTNTTWASPKHLSVKPSQLWKTTENQESSLKNWPSLDITSHTRHRILKASCWAVKAPQPSLQFKSCDQFKLWPRNKFPNSRGLGKGLKQQGRMTRFAENQMEHTHNRYIRYKIAEDILFFSHAISLTIQLFALPQVFLYSCRNKNSDWRHELNRLTFPVIKKIYLNQQLLHENVSQLTICLDHLWTITTRQLLL